MPRINVEDKLYGDFRFIKLVESLGGDYDKAVGMCVRFWRLAQKYYKDEKDSIPLKIFMIEKDAKLFLESGLAKRDRRGIYVHGSHANFVWLRQKSEAGRKGAESRWKKHGDRMGSFNEKCPPTLALTLPTHALKAQACVGEREKNLKLIEKIREESISKARVDYGPFDGPLSALETENREADK